MAFLRIEGVAVDSLIDTFDISDQSVESYNRTANDRLEGITYSDKKEVSFTTPPLAPAEARALEGLVRGRRHAWSFERVDGATTRYTQYSADGGLTLSSAATSTASAFFGTWGLQLNSAVQTTATALFGSEGDWTIGVYQKVPATSASYVFYCLRGTGTAATAFTGTTVAATLGFLQYSAASGFLSARLFGSTVGATSATAHYDGLFMAPYAISDAMLAAAATPLFGLPVTGPTRPPFVTVFGDGLHKPDTNLNGAGEPGPMVCKGFVGTVETVPVVLNGTFQYNARRLQIRLLEK
jgi:hypothetical protein